MNNFEIKKSTIDAILDKNKTALIFEKHLHEINLKDSKSQIVINNTFTLFAAKYSGLAGLFSKEESNTKIFGRAVCDYIKFKFSSYGFFTTDELPRYGIKRAELRLINAIMNKKDTDLIVLFAYPREIANQINSHLARILTKLIESKEEKIELVNLIPTSTKTHTLN